MDGWGRVLFIHFEGVHQENAEGSEEIILSISVNAFSERSSIIRLKAASSFAFFKRLYNKEAKSWKKCSEG